MEQTIHHAITSDEVVIAYAVNGLGSILISVPSPPDNHLQLEWDDAERRRTLEAIGAHRTLVRYDGRGTGMSERNVDDLSLAARVADFEAVVARVGAETFAIMSGTQGTQVSIAYAVAHPERVTHLIAVNPSVRGDEFMAREQLEMWEGLLKNNYRIFTDALGAELYGWGKEQGPRYGEYFRQCVDGPTAVALYGEMLKVDLAPLLGQVQCPVLVIRTQESGIAKPLAATRFAAMLPNATLVFANDRVGESGTAQMVRQVGEFFGEDWSDMERTAAPRNAAPGRLSVILFTDLEAHTSMLQRLGDVRGREVLREHERITRHALATHGGSEVKTLGDGFMASFTSAQQALHCAAALQRAFTNHAGDDDSMSGLRVRIGINAGEPIAEDDDLFGTSVVAAARIAASARGGQVLVANVVRELVAGKGFLFSDMGEQPLRGLDDPVRVWELRLEA